MTKMYFVSPHGNDTNLGTKDEPFKTLTHIQQVVRSDPTCGKESISINLMGGKYQLSSPLVFTELDSGQKNAPIVWKTYEDETVLLSSTTTHKFMWKKDAEKDGLFYAEVPEHLIPLLKSSDTMMYAEGTLLHLARYPNFPGDFSFKGNGVSFDALDEQRISTWTNPKGGIIHGLSTHEWGSVHFKINGKINDSHLDMVQIPTINRQAKLNTLYRFVENIEEELDSPGEYYYNSQNNHLLLYPPAKLGDTVENLNQITFEITNSPTIIEIRGTEQQKVEFLSFEDITFSKTNRTILGDWEPLGRGDWNIVRSGAILSTNAKNIDITNCKFSENGNNSIFISNYNRNISIKNCLFEHIGESAICFVGNHGVLRSASVGYHNSVSYEEMDMNPGPKGDYFPSDCIVENCLIWDIGRYTKQVAGVFISMSRAITVSHCSIFHCTRASICLSEGAFGDHKILNNHVFDVVRDTGDHGPFNSWGRGRHWRDTHAGNPKQNVPDNVVELSKLDMSDENGIVLPILIEGNRFEHGSRDVSGGNMSGSFSWGIDLDDGSSNFIVRNNLCIGCSFKLREGFNRVVENNVCIGPIPPEKHMSYHKHADIIRRNIYVDTQSNRAIHSVRAALFEESKEIDNNLYYSETGETDLSELRTHGIELNSVVANPQFINPDEFNYNVKETSPALQLGFKNFPMDQFGSNLPDFKSRTEEAYSEYRKISQWKTIKRETNRAKPVEWFGGYIKTMTTENEKSATGMHAITGVIVLNTPPQSFAKMIGLQPNDVIIGLNEEIVTNVKEFKQLLDNSEEEENVLKVVRYQKEIEIIL